MDIDYKKHIPGYDKMSRPQKNAQIRQGDDQQDGARQGPASRTQGLRARCTKCVDACEELECVQECKVEFDM